MTDLPRLRSMTGFSSIESIVQGARLRLESRSLNHRFLDLKLRFPREFQSCESYARAYVQSKIKRGAVDLKLDWVRTPGESLVQIGLNRSLIQQLAKIRAQIDEAFDQTLPWSADAVIQFPEMITRSIHPGLEDRPPQELWEILSPLLDEGIQGLILSRENEGHMLTQTLLQLAREVEASLEQLQTLRTQGTTVYPQKIGIRLKKLFDAYPIAEAQIQDILQSRLAQELALLLDRTDIAEELARASHHIRDFQNTLIQTEAQGRKLEFILQEIHREITTLANKAQDFNIGSETVELKVRIEQMREQVLNLE